MGRAFNRFGILAIHALIWTLPFGLFPFDKPSDSQRVYFQVAMSAIALLYFTGAILSGRLRLPADVDSRLPRPLLFGAALIFGCAALLSALGSRNPMFTVRNTAFLWCGILLPAMLLNLRLTREQSRGLLGSLIGVATVCALIGVLQYMGLQFRWKAFGYSPEALKGRFAMLSVLGHPNYVTAFIGPPLLICAGMIFGASGRARLLLIGAALILGLCVFVSGTRSAWMAAAIAGVVIAAAIVREHPKIRLTKPALAGAAAAAIVFLLFAVPNPLVPHRYSFKQRLTTGRSVAPRLYAYLAATGMIRQHPVLGVGYDNYGVEFWDYSDRLQEDARNSVFSYILEDMGGVRSDEAHNEFLQIAAEMGVLGLGAFFFLMAVFVVGLAKDYRRARDGADRLLLAGVAGGVVFVMIDSLFSFPLRLPCSGMAFWLILGVGSRYVVAEVVTKRPVVVFEPAIEPEAPMVQEAEAEEPEPVGVAAGPERPRRRRRRSRSR